MRVHKYTYTYMFSGFGIFAFWGHEPEWKARTRLAFICPFSALGLSISRSYKLFGFLHLNTRRVSGLGFRAEGLQCSLSSDGEQYSKDLCPQIPKGTVTSPFTTISTSIPW